MKRLIFAGLSAMALSGCMGSHLKKLPVCDGKHRRPANVTGSILPALPVPVPISEAGATTTQPTRMPLNGAGDNGATTAPTQVPSPPKTSLRMAPTLYASC